MESFTPNLRLIAELLALIFILHIESFVSCRHWPQDTGSDQKRGEKLEGLDSLEDLVTELPGQPDVDFRHFAGYVTVNGKNGRALFYWFYEATLKPEEKPLVLWLNGGPGCSSVGYGATQEIGPFIVDTNGHGLKYNPYSWNRANDAYNFLHMWFVKFPSYKTRVLYIAGESYAGKYVPELADLIHENNIKNLSLHINLKGILLGNPETSYPEDWRGIVDYAWSHAVISDETHKMISKSCDFNSNNTWDNDDCNRGVEEVLRQYKQIDMYSLYTSTCMADSANNSEDRKFKSSFQVSWSRNSKMMPRIMGGYDPCLDNYAKAYYNRPDVQKALHVNDGRLPKNWTICNMEIFGSWSDSKRSVLPIYERLIAAGLRIWIYSGDTDGRVPVLSTRYWLSSLGLPITKAWSPWYHQKQVSGWYQEYNGLTFATVRGAGHAVPLFKPSESLMLFSSFLNGHSLPSAR
ncbi:serine carboxypeptidase-like 31 isoform X2 [Punica granatum]|uniref:Carboxypeptidase n=1 Tax=Punica granatum TaxID=22663 RepID=A0A6P8E0F0_PUNGR|nr:serine carboxypeptidase-like 31 isoform X2 [Punica granatum]